MKGKKKLLFFILIFSFAIIFGESWHKFGKFEVMYSPDGFYEYDYVHCERDKPKSGEIADSYWFPVFGPREETDGISIVKKLNKKFVFSVKYNDDVLSFDLTNLVMSEINFWHDHFAAFLIHENDDCLDMVINKSRSRFFLIRFDFFNENVKIINQIDTNPVYLYFFEANAYDFLTRRKKEITPYSNSTDFYTPTILNENCQYCYSYSDKVLMLDCSMTGYNERLFSSFKKLDSELKNLNSAYHLFPLKEKYGFNLIPSYIEDCHINNISYSSKSTLVEGKTVYSAANLATFSNTPWVPAEKDLSKEEIVITSKDEIAALMIGNGFYHEDKEYLFLQNRRAKEIVIEYEQDLGFEHHVILLDAAFVQPVPLLDINSKIIKIKILSYYESLKYDDLCINYIGAMKYNYQKIFNRMNEK